MDIGEQQRVIIVEPEPLEWPESPVEDGPVLEPVEVEPDLEPAEVGRSTRGTGVTPAARWTGSG